MGRVAGLRRFPNPLRPALVRQRHDKPRLEAVRAEAAMHLPVELALDHHADQARAEADAPAALGYRAAAFLPVEFEPQPLIAALNRPVHLERSGGAGEAAVFAGIGRKLG